MAVVEADAHTVKVDRKQLRSFLLKGQERLHFSSESSRRRDAIWSGIERWRSPMTVHIVQSSHRYQTQARAECLGGIAALATSLDANLLVIERDDSRYQDDRGILTNGLRGTGLHWEILEAKADPMLWAADAAAWCWTHPSRSWRKRVEPFVGQIIQT